MKSYRQSWLCSVSDLWSVNKQVTVEGEFYHKSCFRCAHAGCFLTTSNYAALDGILYCKPHFSQLFKQKGCYNHLTKTASLKKSAASDQEDNHEAAETKSEPDPEIPLEPEPTTIESESAPAP